MKRMLASLLLTAVLAYTATGFKDGEFKKCADSAFCKRLRGLPGDAYSVDAKSVAIKGPFLTASIKNEAAGKQLFLKLTAYQGLFRLFIDEDASASRFQVPHALLDDIAKHHTQWEPANSKKGTTTISLSGITIVLHYKPLKLEVKKGNELVFVFNGRNLFQFEHLRQKQEGDPEGWWEETFKSHTDTKPKGPEAISLDISFPGAEHVYGIPERAKSLSLPPTTGGGVNSEAYRLYNLDVFEYLEDSPFGLYGSIPLMLAHRPGLTLGAFWLNAAEMLIDVERTQQGTETQWLAESGVVDLFVLLGPTPNQVLKQYSSLTGTTQMPQYFSLGYHQCRWNYRDEADVRQVDAMMDQYDIPYDVIWLDIEHTDGKRYFTWDKNAFPHPKEMQAGLAAHGRKLVTIVDPHIKKDPDYYIYSEAQKLGYLTKNRDGNDFDGWCWPGSSVYIDMCNPAAVQWWTDKFDLSNYQGSTSDLYVWNDMNEPSVFNGPEATMHKDNLHFGNVEHRDLHNLHGLLFHRATALGLQARGRKLFKEGDRTFVLTRSFYAGSQRWGPMWTGDNAATWGALKVSVPMLLASGLAGYPWAGADVGGFFGNPDAELYTRWYQLGAFYPFFRGHAHLDTARREPWVFGEPTTSHVRDAIRKRYALLPYLYTLFHATHEDGSAILRPLWYEFPEQQKLFALDDEFMLGSAILVAPVTEAGQTERAVTLPANALWYTGATGTVAAKSDEELTVLNVSVTIEDIPTYLRGGSIIPTRQRARRSTAAAAKDPFTLIVALDANKAASGNIYLDDGRSFAYEGGHFSQAAFSFKDGSLFGKALANGWDADLLIERVVVLGLDVSKATWSAQVAGTQQPLDVSVGPLYQTSDQPHVALVVRKPALPIVGDWEVKFNLA